MRNTLYSFIILMMALLVVACEKPADNPGEETENKEPQVFLSPRDYYTRAKTISSTNTEYSYDFYGKHPNPSSSSLYTYDEKGRILKDDFYSDGIKTQETEYSYGDKTCTIITRTPAGNLLSKRILKYLDDAMKLVCEEESFSNFAVQQPLRTKMLCEYDGNNLRSKELYYVYRYSNMAHPALTDEEIMAGEYRLSSETSYTNILSPFKRETTINRKTYNYYDGSLSQEQTDRYESTFKDAENTLILSSLMESGGGIQSRTDYYYNDDDLLVAQEQYYNETGSLVLSYVYKYTYSGNKRTRYSAYRNGIYLGGETIVEDVSTPDYTYSFDQTLTSPFPLCPAMDFSGATVTSSIEGLDVRILGCILSSSRVVLDIEITNNTPENFGMFTPAFLLDQPRPEGVGESTAIDNRGNSYQVYLLYNTLESPIMKGETVPFSLVARRDYESLAEMISFHLESCIDTYTDPVPVTIDLKNVPVYSIYR